MYNLDRIWMFEKAARRESHLASLSAQLEYTPRPTRGRDAATASDRATAEDSGRSITAALRKLRDAARGDALLRLALICGVTSWAIMLLVTVPAAAIAVASFKMTTCAAIRALQVQSQRVTQISRRRHRRDARSTG